MSPYVEIVEPRLFPATVADEIVAAVQDAVSERGSCSLVLSGGSTPSSVYRTLSRPPRVKEIDWSNLRLYWGDERWVPKDNSQSNYHMTQETLLSQLRDVQPTAYPVDTNLASPEAGAESYAKIVRENETCNSDGTPCFDVVLLGLGEDGHFASIFPETKILQGDVFRGKDEISLVAKSPYDNSLRVSLTPSALFSARSLYFIVRGEKKSEIVQKVLEGDDSVSKIPANLFRQARGDVRWFIDSGAAQRLEQFRS